MFPGGRSSQNMPGGNSGFPSTYFRDVAAVSNPAWFGNNPTPVPPPVQYPSRAESGRDLLAESYERMRNEMRSLQGSSASKYGGGPSAPPAPSVEVKANPLTQLLENKDVSLSSLLEAAMDPNIGSSKRKEDPIMKKAILDKCEGKIAQLYRLRISGQGMFFPMTQPKIVKFDGVSTLTYNHPRIEFNMLPEEPVWTCPDVVIETKKNEPPNEKKDESEEIVNVLLEQRPPENEKHKDPVPSISLANIDTLQRQRQKPSADAQPEPLLQLLSKPPPPIANVSYPAPSQYARPPPPSEPPPPIANVSYPALSQYRIGTPLNPYARPPPVLPNSGQLPAEALAEMEKERRRREIEIEWDRLMEDKERKDKKQKKKKRSRSGSSSSSRSRSRRSKSRRSRSRHRSHSRGRSHKSRSRGRSSRRSHSRHRSRGRSRDTRYRRRSRSLSSLSLSPPHKPGSLRPLRVRHGRSPSPRMRSPIGRRRSSSFLRSLQAELTGSPRRYRPSPPPRLMEVYPQYGPAPGHPYAESPPGPPGRPSGPPGYDNYYDSGTGPYSNNPRPPGMDNIGPPYGPGMPPYGPMGPVGPGPCGPGTGPWMDPRYGPPGGPGYGPPGGPGYGPPGGPGQWMGPGPGPQWSEPGPWNYNMQRPPMGPRGPTPPAVPNKPPPNNLIDLTRKKTATTRAQKRPVVVVDITNDNDKPAVNSAKVDKKAEPAKSNLPEKPKPKADMEAGKITVNKAEIISDLIPPGVSPDRETHTKYPNVESEFTRPMRAQFRKMLEPLDKVMDKIRLYQRDSFDFKTIIKGLESGKIEFMGVHTLHDGLLCKLEINRQQPDKFFKIVVPFTHIGRVLRAIHSTYHDYSIRRIQWLIDDLFCDPREFSLSKIVSVMKNCKDCIEAEENKRKTLRNEDILILDSPEPDKMGTDEPLPDGENKVVDDPMVRVRKDGPRHRSPEREDRDRKRPKDGHSRRPSDPEKEGKSRKDNERDRTEKSKSEREESQNKSLRKNEGADFYSKFEDLGVSRQTVGAKKAPDREKSKSTNDVGNKEVAKKGVKPNVTKMEEKGAIGSKNGKKVSVPANKVVSKNVKAQVSVEKDKGGNSDQNKEVASMNVKKTQISLDAVATKVTVVKKDPGGSNQAKSNKAEQPKPQQKPVVNPDDFKERVRTVQMGVDNLGSAISDLEVLGKKSPDPALLLKAGMLCRRLPPPKGQGKPEVKIVVTPTCLEQMVEIVHTMAALHAPFQKTVTVFNKHFVPIDGLEKVVSEVLNSCAKCSSDSKK